MIAKLAMPFIAMRSADYSSPQYFFENLRKAARVGTKQNLGTMKPNLKIMGMGMS